MIVIKPITLSPMEMFHLAQAIEELWAMRASHPSPGDPKPDEDPLQPIFRRIHNEE